MMHSSTGQNLHALRFGGTWNSGVNAGSRCADIQLGVFTPATSLTNTGVWCVCEGV